MNSENGVLTLSIKDLFTGKMLKYSVAPFFVSMLVLYLLFFVVAGIGLDSLGSMDIQSTSTTIENGVPHTDSFTASLEGTALIQWLMSHSDFFSLYHWQLYRTLFFYLRRASYHRVFNSCHT